MASHVTGPLQLLAEPLDRDLGVSGQQIRNRGFECIELAGVRSRGLGGLLLGAVATGVLDLLQDAPDGMPADPQGLSDPSVRRTAVEQSDDLASKGGGHGGAIFWAGLAARGQKDCRKLLFRY
jgi:hypothetical protein